MRLLCDHHVASKYLEAFQRADDISVSTVADEIAVDASDTDIATVAERGDRVVFTNDDDFFEQAGAFGLLVYSQIEDPAPSDVLDAVRAIDRAYESNVEIVETVPGEWV